MANFYEQKKKPYLKDLIVYDDNIFFPIKKKFYYCLTQTFAPMSLNEKVKHITSIGAYIATTIGCHSMYYTIEYHKKSNKQDLNPFAPHLHGILMTDVPLRQETLKYLTQDLQHRMGKCSIYPQEDHEELNGWYEYCRKELPTSDARFNLRHEYKYSVQLSKVITDIDYLDL